MSSFYLVKYNPLFSERNWFRLWNQHKTQSLKVVLNPVDHQLTCYVRDREVMTINVTSLLQHQKSIYFNLTNTATKSTFYLPNGLRRRRIGRRVVSVYDMIPELMPSTRRRLDFLTLKERYIRTADQLICISESTKRDLPRVYGGIAAPVHVVHLGVSPHFRPGVQRADFLPERYILFVGHRHQYKDAEILFRAFAEVAQVDHEVELLCVGGNGLSNQEGSMLEELGIRRRVSQRFLSDDLMPTTYSNAELFVFPSRFEGFGLPALEAMASGTPTILARSTSLPEIGGDGALYFAPGDIPELADCINAVLTDASLSRSLSDSGLERARTFTWRRNAQRTAEVYREAVR